MNTRYFVDERVGCIAVRDRQHPEHDPSHPGLHSDMPDIVKFWCGKHYTEMLEDGACWYVPRMCGVAAHRLCNKLNEEA